MTSNGALETRPQDPARGQTDTGVPSDGGQQPLGQSFVADTQQQASNAGAAGNREQHYGSEVEPDPESYSMRATQASADAAESAAGGAPPAAGAIGLSNASGLRAGVVTQPAEILDTVAPSAVHYAADAKQRAADDAVVADSSDMSQSDMAENGSQEESLPSQAADELVVKVTPITRASGSESAQSTEHDSSDGAPADSWLIAPERTSERTHNGTRAVLDTSNDRPLGGAEIERHEESVPFRAVENRQRSTSTQASKMKQPISQEELFLPLLFFLADHGGEIDRARDNLLIGLADRLGLSTAERERTTENGREQWRADVEFCRQKLIEYWGALQSTAESGWGVWKLSEAGKKIVESPPRELLEKFNAWTSGRLRSLPVGAKKPPERHTGYSDVRLAQIREAVSRSRNEELRKKRQEALDKATHQEQEHVDHSGSPMGNDTTTIIQTPSGYRPVPRRPSERPERAHRSQKAAVRRRALPIEVRAVIQPGGFCRISLLPRRGAGQPDRVSVVGTGNPDKMSAMQDEWYEDVVLESMGDLLRRGIEWRPLHAGETGRRWTLSGRDIYVLGKHPSVRGYVTKPRLIIGEDHVVLCSVERLPDVTQAIALAGSPTGSRLDPDRGAPAGWVVLRGIVPTTPVAQSQDGDILDALRPLAEAEITLEGGISIGRRTWLCGYPPRVRLTGDTASVNRVLIDAQEAALGADGGYEAPGWDSPGEHSVWCESGSRSYAISLGLEAWEPWEAYPWLIENVDAEHPPNQAAVCGVMIRPAGASAFAGRTVLVPGSNTLLLGPLPGEIYRCQLRSDLRARISVGYPPFEPVWALPLHPLRADKRACAVLALADSNPGNVSRDQAAKNRNIMRGSRESVDRWCNAILDAGRKGLRVDPSDAWAVVLWEKYKQTARTIWRRLR